MMTCRGPRRTRREGRAMAAGEEHEGWAMAAGVGNIDVGPRRQRPLRGEREAAPRAAERAGAALAEM
jgi:hypothetical protein